MSLAYCCCQASAQEAVPHGWVTIGIKDHGSSDHRDRMGKAEAEVTRKVRNLVRSRDAGHLARAGFGSARGSSRGSASTAWSPSTSSGSIPPGSRGPAARRAQTILGHSRPAVTQEVYTHEDRLAQREALGKIGAAERPPRTAEDRG
jgi:hypothetical protein